MNKIRLVFTAALLAFALIFTGCPFDNEEVVFTIEVPALFHWQTHEPEGYEVTFTPDFFTGKRINKYERFSLSMKFESNIALKDMYFVLSDTTEEANWWTLLSWISIDNNPTVRKNFDETITFYTGASATSDDPRANRLVIGGKIDDPSNLKPDDKLTLTFTRFNFKEELPMEADYKPPTPSGLPVLQLDLRNGSVPPELQNVPPGEVNWISGADYRLSDKNGNLLTAGKTEIRARGNSTRWMPKTPYNLRLNNSASMLEMPPHKRWALLANYSDKTLLRTEVAFELGRMFDKMKWVPRSEAVEVYLNGAYRGVYQLTENVRVDPNRVNIPEISASNGNGGYLLEIDQRLGEDYHFWSSHGLAFNCSSPDSNLDMVITDTGKTIFETIRSHVQHVEDVLYSSNFADPVNGWQKYLDMDSFIDFYFVNEITMNNDAVSFSSIYLYYDPATEKMCMGPLWDFDLSSGNYEYQNDVNTRWLMRDSPWLARLFQDPYFVYAVKLRWNEKKAEIDTILPFIDTRASYLNTAQAYNFNKWLILDKYVWPNAVVKNSYTGEIEYLKTWLSGRINWLNREINRL